MKSGKEKLYALTKSYTGKKKRIRQLTIQKYMLRCINLQFLVDYMTNCV